MNPTHIPRSTGVWAVQWTGSNRFEVQAHIARMGDPEEIGPYFSADEESGEPYDNYNTVQFYAWNDDQEVDPTNWIVFFYENGDDGKVMTDKAFRAKYREAS